MRRHWLFWTVTGLAALGFVLIVVNMVLFLGNRRIQGEVNTRQQFINQTLALDRLNREIIQALASLAARNNDDQLRGLLAEHGISFTVTPTPAPAPAPKGTR